MFDLPLLISKGVAILRCLFSKRSKDDSTCNWKKLDCSILKWACLVLRRIFLNMLRGFSFLKMHAWSKRFWLKDLLKWRGAKARWKYLVLAWKLARERGFYGVVFEIVWGRSHLHFILLLRQGSIYYHYGIRTPLHEIWDNTSWLWKHLIVVW